MEAFFMQVFNGKFHLKVYIGTTGISHKKKNKYWLVCSQLPYQKSLAQKGFAELRAISFIISPRRQGHLSKFCWIEPWQEMQIDIAAQKMSTSSCHSMFLLSKLTFYCHQNRDEIFMALPDNISVSNGRFLSPDLMSPASGPRQNMAQAGFEQHGILIEILVFRWEEGHISVRSVFAKLGRELGVLGYVLLWWSKVHQLSTWLFNCLHK